MESEDLEAHQEWISRFFVRYYVVIRKTDLRFYVLCAFVYVYTWGDPKVP
jgi:hypothetical protein